MLHHGLVEHALHVAVRPQRLTGGGAARSADGMVLTLTLLDVDINAHTKDEGLAVDDGAPFLLSLGPSTTYVCCIKSLT